jgi:hypothetical protein
MKNLYKALFAALKELGPCPMTGKGQWGGPYATLPDVISHTKPVLAKHGLFISHLYNGTNLIARLIHAESGETLDSEAVMVLDKPVIKEFGSTTTYFRRFSTLSMLGLETDPDKDDAAHATKPKQVTQHVTRTMPVRHIVKPLPTKPAPIAGISQKTIGIGKKYAGKRYGEVSLQDLEGYADWLKNQADQTGKPVSWAAQQFIDDVSMLAMEHDEDEMSNGPGGPQPPPSDDYVPF